MSDLIQKAVSWKQEADKLLQESNLVAILGDYGNTVISGSYHYDLMLLPDIDIYLIVKEPEVTARNLLQKLVDQRYWNGYMFYDWVKFRSESHVGFPQSYYLGLKTTFHQHRWKVDVWVVRQEEYDKLDNSWITNKLNEENKSVILAIKAARNSKELDVSSYVIYDAVLNKGVSSLDEFRKSLTRD